MLLISFPFSKLFDIFIGSYRRAIETVLDDLTLMSLLSVTLILIKTETVSSSYLLMLPICLWFILK